MASAYANGHGVPQNYAEAANGLDWLRTKASPLLSIILDLHTAMVRASLRTLCSQYVGPKCRRLMAIKMPYKVETLRQSK